MSAPLFGFTFPNPQAFVLAWLAPLGACGSRRNPDDPLPFRMVTTITGEACEYYADPVVSVHTFGDASVTQADTYANREADITHRRMMLLAADPTQTVTVNSVPYNCSHVLVKELPIKVDYRDTTVIRYVARYELGFSPVPVTS